jgi:catechol 2,3-dioxygenase
MNNSSPQADYQLDPATTIGWTALTIARLERSVQFYTDVLGFAVLQQQPGTAVLGVERTPLLVLVEQPGVRPRSPRTTGLFHFAILVPSRVELGRSLRRLVTAGYPLEGASDHLVSEALYLSDPDNNGIEIYRDRPRDEWRWTNGQVAMASEPVDLAGLVGEAERDGRPWTGLAAGTRIGHMHLQVADIQQAETFYHGVFGFDVAARWPGALFVSAGGYHHHLGLNTWYTKGAPQPPAGAASGWQSSL